MTNTTKRKVAHATFSLERDLAHPPAKVFAAWATKDAKARWFGGFEGCKDDIREMDFREGGSERVRIVWPQRISDFTAHYHEIVPGERIVYSYKMHIDDVPISVSLATVEFKAAGAGTKLVITEQGAFLDDYKDDGARARGTAMLLDRLAASL